MPQNNNQRILYDEYNIYYEKGIAALNDKKYSIASRNLFNASKALFELAKLSSGALKTSRISRANEIYNIASNIEKKMNEEKAAKIKQPETNPKPKDDEELTVFKSSKNTGVSMDDVAGLKEAKQEIIQKVIEPNKHPDIFDKFKKSKGGGILLYGVPGTGKTMLAQAIAHEIDAEFFTVKCSDILSKWVGDAEQNIRRLFEEARKYQNSIIFFDEFESLAPKRDSNSTVMKRVVPELLTQIQGFEKNENNLIVIAATNRPWDIDTAFLRPGRFDRTIYVPLPDYEARKAIIENKLKSIPCDPNLNISEIAEITEGFNGADVANFCEKLKDLAIARELSTNQPSFINQEDVVEARKTIHSSVFNEDIEKCSKYRNEHN